MACQPARSNSRTEGMKSLNYGEGTWFGVPLRKGGYATGLVGRAAPRGKIILGFFFGPKRIRVPTLKEVSDLFPFAAIKCCRVGDLGLLNGDWPIIGNIGNLDHELWKVPLFSVNDNISNRKLLSIYSDSDPSKITS